MVLTPRIRLVVAIVAVCAVAGIFVALGSGGGHPAHAATAAAGADTVTVDGVGTVQGVPDRLTATFGVHVTRGSVRDALDGVAANAKHLINALHRAGVGDKFVRTTDLQLSPHYDNSGRRSGYDGSESVAATFTELGRAGKAISDTAASVGDAATIDGIGFDLSSDSTLLAQARSAAYADAKARAAQYARLAGRSLGTVLHVTETVTSAPGQPPYYKTLDGAAASGLSAAPVPVASGQQPVTVTVTVVWQLS